MNLSKHGKNISQCEVSNISLHGLWILLDDEEYFIAIQEVMNEIPQASY